MISGELPEPLAEVAETVGRAWLPFSQAVADELLEMPGARLDPRALRCASRLQVGQEPPPATLALVESVGEPRFALDVNWDPETIPAFLALPACEAHGRSLPVDPYLLEPLEHYLRTYRVEPAANAAEAWSACGRARRGDRRGAAVARTAPELEIEDRLGGELRLFQRAAVAYALEARRAFLADEQGLGKTVQALATLEVDDAYPAVVVCPASLKLNWQREIEHWLPHRSVTVVSGTGGVAEPADITVINYEIVHATASGCLRRPRALVLDESHYVKNLRAKRTQAVRKLAESLG